MTAIISLLAALSQFPDNACSDDNIHWWPAREGGQCFLSDKGFGLEYRGRLKTPHCEPGWNLNFVGGGFVCVMEGHP